MEVKIVFNNDVVSDKFISGWGFSCLVDNRVLFDTGEKAEYLFNNMRNLNINISSIEMAVISHDHWDHTGGLWELLEKRKGLKVYACPHFSRAFKDKVKKLKAELIEAEKIIEITKNIFITGEILKEYRGIPEQALAIKTSKGITVITGCSHPGIVRIIEKVKEANPSEKICLVFGGFHLMNSDKREVRIIAERLKEMGVEKAGPTHCTGYEAQEIFKEEYADNFISIKAGQVFEV
ncbi:MAG: MBL fold metallo-hydrolase [Candidatus Omnitrophica bacterium]|nr:MBL fold metallo-hydrolase [Candidatus Omnitrophota bacterium]